MGRVGEKLDIDFVVSTRVNFYDTGLTGVDDDAFEQSFTDIYRANSLQKPWYLGNWTWNSRSSITSSIPLVSMRRRKILLYYMFTEASLCTRAFSVLGNHDYKGDALAQFSPALRKIDSRFICMRSFIVNAGANLLVIGLVWIHGRFSIRRGFYSLQLRIAPL